MTEQDYFIALQVFRMNKESLKITSPEVTDWAVLNESLTQQIDGIPDLKDLIVRFLRLFVAKINFGPRSFIIPTKDGMANIEPEQLGELQALVGRVGGAHLLKPNEEEFRPINRQAAAIAEKMKKARARLRAQQPQNTSRGFISRYIRAVSTATSNTLQDTCNMTLYQLDQAMQTYLAYEAYDLEVRSRLAGAKGDDKLIHWMMRDKEDEGQNIGTI